MQETKVLILGGGFAGTKCALELQKKNLENVKITIISDRPHFEYHGALYRVVAGHSPLEVCLPLCQVLDERKVEIVEDKITKIDHHNHEVHGESGSTYTFDHLVIALGSETNYFDIPGLEEHSFGMKTIPEALALKRHIHETIEDCVKGTKEDKLCGGNFVVVGGGPTGTELAAELAVYTKKLAKTHGVEPSLMNVELIEAGPRILPKLPEAFAKKIEAKMRSLGVNIRTNRAVLKEDVENVYLRDMQLKTKTVVWTAGVAANRLIKEAGFSVNEIGRAEIDDHLHAKDYTNVYLSGDVADTPYSGMSQTALYDGEYIADAIELHIKKNICTLYEPQKVAYSIPVGPGWAGTMWKGMVFYGRSGWVLRRLADLQVFMKLLPFRKALEAFSSHRQTCEACPVCCAYEDEYQSNL